MLSRCSAALLVMAASASADTLHVPAQFTTIQAAVDVAQDGDSIVVAKGVYPESVVVQDKSNLVLRGAGKPVIDATGLVTGLTVDDCVGVEVRGFVVRNAVTTDVLIQFSGEVTVDKCRLESSGTGLKSVSSSSLHIQHNDIRDQSDNGLWFAANPALSPSDIVANRLRTMATVGLRIEMPHILVDKNRIDGPLEIGIELDTGANDVTVSRNRISGADAGGLIIASGTGHAAEHNTIKGCDAGLAIEAGTEATTLHNRIIAPVSYGIRVDPSGCALEGDRITSGVAHGVELNGNGNSLTDVLVSKAGNDGWVITGSGNALTGCKALHCGEFGIFVSGTGNIFTQLKAKGSGTFDVDDTAPADSNTYLDCTIGTQGP